MKWQQYITGLPILIITFFVVLFGVVTPSHAIDRVSVENLQAAMRTLSFLESLPKEGTIVVGVIYPADLPATKVLAGEAAQVIGSLRGANFRILQPLVLSTNDLTQFEGHLDLLVLVMGASKHPEVIL